MEMETAGVRTGCNFTDEFCKPVVFCMGYLYPTWWKCYYLFLLNPMLKLIHTTWTNIIKSIYTLYKPGLSRWIQNISGFLLFATMLVSTWFLWFATGSLTTHSLLLSAAVFSFSGSKEEILHRGNGRRKTAKPIHT